MTVLWSVPAIASAQPDWQPVSFNVLLGNVGTVRSPEPDASIATLETVWAAQALPNFFVEGPDASGAEYGWMAPNFYDRVRWGYQYAQHTGRQDVLDRTRFIARQIATHPWVTTNVVQLANVGWKWPDGRNVVTPAPRDYSAWGLALAAADARDPQLAMLAKATLGKIAFLGAKFLTTHIGDPREIGYSLQALVLAVAVDADASFLTGTPMDFRVEARKKLDLILAHQLPAGWWRSAWPNSAGHPETPVYMEGIILEGLLLYDRVIGDPRIMPAVLNAMTWLEAQYQTSAPANGDNAAGAGGWWYSVGQPGNDAGTIAYNGNVYPSLSGVVLPAIVGVAQHTGDARWRTLADKAFQSLIRDANHPRGGLRGSKEINQAGRGVWLTAGWRATRN